jgi:heavy metal sensor kinase
MKPLPFRLRLAALSALISGVVLIVFGGLAWHFICRERLAALDREIRSLAYRHPGWLGERGGFERLSPVIESVFGADRREQVLVRVATVDGELRYRSPHWPEDLDPARIDLPLEDDPQATPASLERARREAAAADPVPGGPRGPPWSAGPRAGRGGFGPGLGRQRGGVLPPSPFSKAPRFVSVTGGEVVWRFGLFGHDAERLFIGLNQTELQVELNRLRAVFLGTLPLALLAVGSGGWLVAGRAMRPLRAIARTAERVTAQGLDQRIAASAEDPEIARLISVLNGMMDRLEASFHQATRFSSDASHELRTPLAVMQGELEQALQSAVPGSPEQRLFAGLLEEAQRLKTITRGLLLLAQADAGQLAPTRAPVPLSAELGRWLEDFADVVEAAGIESVWEIEPGLVVDADASLLRQALLNLLHNAVTYNEPGGRVGVTLKGRDTELDLAVWNTGPGIPAADQPRVFDRFFRVDAARSRRVEGVGLGLSLAREIVRVHGGGLELEESRPGWTCFRLTLPRHRAGLDNRS